MRKSFTRLLGLVMFLMLFSSVVMATFAGDATKVLPIDITGGAKAWTKTTDKIMVIYPGVVQASTGSIRVSAGGTLVRVLTATDSRVSYAKGDTVVIDLSADLKELTNYTVDIDNSTFKTVATTPAIKGAETWTFTTGDYTGPTLKSVVPVSGSVSPTATISLVMTFEDQSSNALLKGSGKIAVYKADGNVWDLIDVSSANATFNTAVVSGIAIGRILTVTGVRTLEDNVNYAVTVGAGVVTDDGQRADAKKNAFAGLSDRTVWKFSTQDYSAPVFASGYPKIGTVTNNSASVLIKTTEAGKAYAAIATTATTSLTADDIIALNNSVTLATAGTEYSVNFTQIGGVDLSGNTNYYIYVVTVNADGEKSAVTSTLPTTDVIKTKETVAPVLATVTYKKSDTYTLGATVNSGTGVVSLATVDQKLDKIVLTFNEDQAAVSIGAGNVIIRKVADNSDYLVIPSTSLTVNPDNKLEVTIPITKALENNTSYYVIVPNTLILDKYSNKYAGISATNGWLINSNDVITPIYTSVPVEGALGVLSNATIKISFSELITANTNYNLASASSVTSPNESPFQLVDGNGNAFGAATVSPNDGKFTSVILTPSSPFLSGSLITVKIKPSAIKDIAGNVITTEQGFSFVVKDTEGPKILLSGGSSVTNKWTVPTTPTGVLKLGFDEAIYLLGGGAITNDNLYSLITLKNFDNSLNIPATYSIDANKKVITITPTSPWLSKGKYYAAITSDLQDVNGNPFAGANRIYNNGTGNYFMLNDVVPATVDIKAAGADLSGKSINISDEITFTFKDGTTAEVVGQVAYGNTWNVLSAASDLAKVIIFKEGSASGKDVPFNVSYSAPSYVIAPSSALIGAKTYYIGIGASTKDATTLGTGNINVAKFTTFNTLFAGAPTLAGSKLTPADDATGVARKAALTLEFICDVELNTTNYGTSPITVGGTAITAANIVVSGKTVTIKHTDFAPNANVSVIVPANVIQNVNDGAFFAGLTTATAWNFATVDESFALASTPFKPDGNAADLADMNTAANNSKLIFAGAEKFSKGTGFIYVKNSATDALVERINVTSDQVVVSDSTSTTSKATISLAVLMKYGQTYYVEVDKGAFVDLSGNQQAAIVGKTPGTATWTFKTIDAALVIVKVTPNIAELVAVNSPIVVEFNRDIAALAGEVGYTQVVATVADEVKSDPINSSNITISGNKLTITHTDPFPANAEIYLYMAGGAVNAVGNTSNTNAALNKGAFHFSTGNTLAPVAKITPANYNSASPVYVNVNTDVTIEINEDFYLLSGGIVEAGDLAGIFQLFNGSTQVNCLNTISGRIVTLNPTADLAENTVYTVKIIGNKIKDIANNVLGYDGSTTTNVTSDFMTYDVTAPVLADMALTGGITNLTLDYKATDSNLKDFYYLVKLKSEGANPTAAQVKAGIKRDPAPTTNSAGTITISDLLASTEYEVFYVADDTRGNVSTVAKLGASTTDTVAPTLVSTNPAKGSVDVNVDGTLGTVIKLTFNEAVVKGTTTATDVIVIREKTTQAIIGTLGVAALTPVTTPTTDAKSLNLTIPTSIIAANIAPVSVYIEMAYGTVKDLAASANYFVGAFGPDAIYFTTEDNNGPALASSGSTSGSVALNSIINVKFDQAIQAGTGNIVLYTGTSAIAGNAVEVFKGSEVTISGQIASFKPTANLTLGQPYFVSVKPSFVFDTSSNKNPNASLSISFTASSNGLPVAVVANPAGGATAIPKLQIADGFDVSFVNAVGGSIPVYYPIAGYAKALLLMNQAEILNQVSLKNGAGTAIAINITNKTATGFKVVPVSADDIKDETAYTLTITGFQDGNGQIMTTKVVNCLTSDGLAPSITYSPVNEKTAVDPMSVLTLTFSENVYEQVIDADKNIFAYIDNTNVKSYVYLSKVAAPGVDIPFTASITGKVITITPTAKLESGVKYYYGLLRTVVDINTTPRTATGVYFNAADYTIPALATLNVTNFKPLGAGTAATATMSVTFQEEVLVSTGSVVIRHEDGTIFQTVSGTGLTIGTDKITLKIAHNNFEPFTNYFVEIGASTVVDKSGNANALFNDPTPAKGWLFTTSDTYDLTAAVTPKGENTPRSVNLEMAFNKVPTGIANKFIALYKADGTAVHQVLASSLTANGKTISIPVSLDANQAYYARVEADAFVDGSGNKFAGIMDKSWVFSTVDNIAPKLATVAALSPANNATNVAQSTDLSITFDRPVVKGTGVITVRNKVTGVVFTQVDVANTTVNGSMLSISLPVALEKNVSYYVLVPAGAVTNTEVTKDPFAGIINTYDWTFTTGNDVVAPTFVSGAPSGSTNLKPAEVTLVGTFSEKLAVGTGNVIIYNAADDTKVETIAVLASMVNVNKLTVVPTALEVSKSYYVLIDAGSVKDVVGISFAGLTDKTTWKFSTGDYTGPTVVVTPPVSPVATVFTVGLKFNEPVSGVLGGVTVTGGTLTAVDGLGDTYTLTISTLQQKEVTIVLTDVIKDMSPNMNKFAGQTLIYTTGDFTAPALATWTPYDVTTTNNHPTFKMTFSEDVVLGAGGALKVYKVNTSTAVLTIPLTAAMITGKDVTVSYAATQLGLDKDTRYYVLVDGTALKDKAGNAFVGVSNVTDWIFKTGATFLTDVPDINNSLEFKVYPNPFVDYVNVANVSELSKIVVTNIAGQMVKEIVNPTERIQLNELRSGIYFMSLYNTEDVIVRTAKIVKR